jgi:hypothetical protein
VPPVKLKFGAFVVLGLAWLQVTDIAVDPTELTVSIGSPVIVQPTGEVHTVPVPARVFPKLPVAWVPVKPVQLMPLSVGLPPPQVTVTAPESAVKNAVSPEPGTLAPLAPPSVADQFVVELFQVVVPPTQYLLAI